MFEIIPGILEKEWTKIERKINIVKPFAKTVQIDIIDGIYAPNATFLDPQPFAKYTGELFLEIHLMVKDPIKYLDPFAKAGFKRFVAQIEGFVNVEDQEEFVAQGELLGEVGLAIDKNTDIDAIKVSLDDLDNILIMSVKAGASGQEFDQKVLEKIKALRKKTSAPIEIDGGLNLENIILAKNAGATRFSVNSYLFKANNIEEQYNLIKNNLEI